MVSFPLTQHELLHLDLVLSTCHCWVQCQTSINFTFVYGWLSRQFPVRYNWPGIRLTLLHMNNHVCWISKISFNKFCVGNCWITRFFEPIRIRETNWILWHLSVIPTLRRPKRRRNCQFNVSLCYIQQEPIPNEGWGILGKKLRQHSDVKILYQNNLEETSTIFLSLGCQTQIGITD